MVYADDADHMSSPGQVPVPTRGVHDLDGLMRRLDSPPATGAPDHWLAAAPPLMRSHITPVPLRPPRA